MEEKTRWGPKNKENVMLDRNVRRNKIHRCRDGERNIEIDRYIEKDKEEERKKERDREWERERETERQRHTQRGNEIRTIGSYCEW